MLEIISCQFGTVDSVAFFVPCGVPVRAAVSIRKLREVGIHRLILPAGIDVKQLIEMLYARLSASGACSGRFASVLSSPVTSTLGFAHTTTAAVMATINA
jgi:hypothetical protein